MATRINEAPVPFGAIKFIIDGIERNGGEVLITELVDTEGKIECYRVAVINKNVEGKKVKSTKKLKNMREVLEHLQVV